MQALPFIAAAGSLVQGVGGLMAGNANAKAARRQGAEERRNAAAQIRRVRTDARRQIGEQYAAMAGNGFEGAASGGTALDALQESQIEAALDVLELRRQGTLRGQALDYEAAQQKRQGRFALVSGILGAGSSYLRADADWAQPRRSGGGGGGGGSGSYGDGSNMTGGIRNF